MSKRTIPNGAPWAEREPESLRSGNWSESEHEQEMADVRAERLRDDELFREAAEAIDAVVEKGSLLK